MNKRRPSRSEHADAKPALPLNFADAETALEALAAAFLHGSFPASSTWPSLRPRSANPPADTPLPSLEDRYRVLVEQIPAVVFMAILDGGISEAWVSPQIEQMLGFSQEEWLDDPTRWYQQIHPDDRQRWSQEAAQFIASGTPLKSAYRVIARDGRTLWFRCEAKLVRKEDGRPWFIHGVGFDITELKETEAALHAEIAERKRLEGQELERERSQAEEARFKLAAIVESSDDAIVGKDLHGIVNSWNAAATRLFGYSPEEMIGQSILRLIPPELHAEEAEILRKLQAGERIEHFETRRITKSGTPVDVSLTISPIRNASGQVIGASKIARDITERQRAQEALRESEERFRTMAETAADAIFRIDGQSTILFANRAAEQVFGYRSDELVGRELTILMPEYLRAVHRTAVARYLRTGRRRLNWERFEVTGLHKDGRELALEISLGESVKDLTRSFTGFVRDITDRKRIEEKLRMTEKLAATGRLAATISHEINNPLEGVINFVYLAMTDPEVPGHVRQYLENADRELQRVSHIARQTLGFYRDTTAPVKINVPELLGEVLELYRGKIDYKSLHLDTRFDRSCEIQALQGEIRQVFSNILVNAIEASPEQGVLVLRVAPARDWKDPERVGVRVSIADHGRGIPANVRSKVFEPFYSTKQNVGTGLGLWVSKSLVEKHGGSIRFRSSDRPGRSGSVFSVFLPHTIESDSSSQAA